MDRPPSSRFLADAWRRLGTSSARRQVVVVGSLLFAGLLLGVGVAAAHGTHASALAQRSADGTVVVQQAFLSGPGYLVLRADDGGEPGRVLGHRAVGPGLHTGTRVTLDRSFWRSVDEQTRLWLVVHGSNGDDQFDPAADPLQYWYSAPAGERVTIGKADHSAAILTNGTGTLEAGAVSVREAILPARGHVVVHARENGSLGTVLGARTLPAGRHRGVSVPVDTSRVPTPHSSVSVVLYGDDGDGAFEAGTDPIQRVAGEPIASRYTVRAADEPRVRINTPASPVGGADAGGPSGGRSAATTGGDGPGFGLLAGAAALLAAVVAAVVTAIRRSGGN
jgi:hypothetical protein